MFDLPKPLISRLQKIYPEQYEMILENFSKKRVGSFRVNLLNSSLPEVEDEFQAKGIIFKKFRDFENIFIFDREFEYAIKWTKAFYEGKIYLQSIASMLPVFVLEPKQWEKILDVCAAPGSKTTQISMLQQNNGAIIALEKNQIRADKLAYNCRLQSANNIEIHKIDARKFLQNTELDFDKILLDAPCSAEGRIDLQNEKSFGFWSEKNIIDKAELQYELLDLSWSKLKKWWVLVYSTCTLAPEENEANIEKFLQNHSDSEILEIPHFGDDNDFSQNNILEFEWKKFEKLGNKGIRILPTEFTEWFFMVKIQKVSA